MTGQLYGTRRAILEVIVAYKRAHDGNSPTVQELAQRVGRGTSVIHWQLRVLEQMGLIRLSGDRGSARRICVVGGRWEMDDADENGAG